MYLRVGVCFWVLFWDLILKIRLDYWYNKNKFDFEKIYFFMGKIGILIDSYNRMYI